MENKIKLVWILLVIILAFAGLKFSGITGLAVYDASSSIFVPSNITRTQSVDAINSSYLIIDRLRNENFSVTFFEDMLLNAKKTLEIADYAVILRNSSANAKDRQIALSAVQFANWKNIDYGSVINITENILVREGETYLVSDRILAQQVKIDTSKKTGVNVSIAQFKLDLANIAFKNERYGSAMNLVNDQYGETNNLIIQSQTALEEAIAINSQTINLRLVSMNFFRRYWVGILIFFSIFAIFSLIFYKKIRLFNLRRQVDKLHSEKQALHNLLITAQKERFVENKISGLVYNVRLKNYQDRMNQIDEEIPVLEAKLADKVLKNIKLKKV